GPGLFLAIMWVHPVVLAVTWAHSIIWGTRIPAAELERGTIDVLMGLPVSRARLYVLESVTWVLGAAVVVGLGVLGNKLGSMAVNSDMRAPMGTMIIAACSLYTLMIAVGALAWLVSSLSDRRGKAITIVFVIVVASVLVNYLAQLWKPAEKLAVFSLVHYHRPIDVFNTGKWPARDMAVLLGFAAACWVAGLLVFSRRDLRTV
ncbi:MAG TPA: ABC transporter permease subunit, partial [Phycisphaerales bacterium]|nr:ABC transporter permease subunit [Phycisphaerales bacterium]